MSIRKQRIIQVSFLAALLAVMWWYAGTHTSVAIVPIPKILQSFKDAWIFDRFGSDVVPTLGRLAVGYLLSVVIAIPLGLALGMSRFFRALAIPAFSFFRAIPPVALIPAAIVVFGIGNATNLVLVVIVCIWPIVLNTADGVAERDSTMLSTARVFRLTGLARLRYCTLPAVAPRIFAGLQTSLAFALIVVIAGEYLAGTDGIGFFIFQAQSQFAIADMFAGIILLAMIGVLLNIGLVQIQRRVVFWRGDSR